MPTMIKISLLLAAILFVSIDAAYAQYTEPVDSSQTQILGDTAMDGKYMVPDLSKKWLSWSKYNGKKFTLKIGFAPIVDYSTFIQDNDSKTQVGKQNGKAELRSGRFSIAGQLKFKQPWSYFLSLEYKGLDREPDEKNFGITDLYLTIPVGKVLGRMTIGKIKEPFVYEMVGDAANLPFTERIFSPFFVSRNVGIKFSNTFAKDDRMTWTAGWFNNWWLHSTDFKNSSNQFAARITGLPLYRGDNEYLHLGISGRYVQAASDKLRLKGSPESNVTDYYVDTKDFDADHSTNMGLEGLWSIKSFSLLTEYVHTWTKAPTVGNPQFEGFYVTGSWLLSGEERKYDKVAAYARRVIPKKKYGAIELVARYSNINLTDRAIDGGVMKKMYLGFNWWATQYWRVSFGYGLTGLQKDNIYGVTNSFIWRLQWIY